MIIDRTHQSWIFSTTAVALLGTVAYLIYSLTIPAGPRGGSGMGLVFGFAGTGLIVFECLLSLRKKYPASPFGRVHTWLKAHVWLGLLSFLLILFHAGFRLGHGLAFVLMALFLLITVSGVLGLALQGYIPRRMKELVKKETPYEQIPDVVQGLRLEADERAEFLTAGIGIEELPDESVLRGGGKKYYFDPAQFKSAMDKLEAVRVKRREKQQVELDGPSTTAMKAHYLEEIRPFLRMDPRKLSQELFHTEATVAAYFDRLRTLMPPPAHAVLGDLEQIVEERRQLGVQMRLHHLLHFWLLVHVPVSMTFLALTAIHAVMSLRY